MILVLRDTPQVRDGVGVFVAVPAGGEGGVHPHPMPGFALVCSTAPICHQWQMILVLV
jgi:hypothetical protein